MELARGRRAREGVRYVEDADGHVFDDDDEEYVAEEDNSEEGQEDVELQLDAGVAPAAAAARGDKRRRPGSDGQPAAKRSRGSGGKAGQVRTWEPMHLLAVSLLQSIYAWQ